jgi:hypothetical protein
MIRYFSCGLLILCYASCGDSQAQLEALVQSEYERKLSMIYIEREQKCQEEVLRLAESIVDSLIRNDRFKPLTEEAYDPWIPERPSFIKPDSAFLNSQNNVKPIIK